MRPSFSHRTKNVPGKLDSRKTRTPFHRQCLANDAARGFRNAAQFVAELKFHRDAGDNAQRKI